MVAASEAILEAALARRRHSAGIAGGVFSDEGKAEMKQLVRSWVEAEKDGYGHSQTEAIAYLSRECGITLNHSRLAEWRSGKHTPCPAVTSKMLHRVLPWALFKIGLKPSSPQLDSLEDLLFTTNTVGDEREIELFVPRSMRKYRRDKENMQREAAYQLAKKLNLLEGL